MQYNFQNFKAELEAGHRFSPEVYDYLKTCFYKKNPEGAEYLDQLGLLEDAIQTFLIAILRFWPIETKEQFTEEKLLYVLGVATEDALEGREEEYEPYEKQEIVEKWNPLKEALLRELENGALEEMRQNINRRRLSNSLLRVAHLLKNARLTGGLDPESNLYQSISIADPVRWAVITDNPEGVGVASWHHFKKEADHNLDVWRQKYPGYYAEVEAVERNEEGSVETPPIVQKLIFGEDEGPRQESWLPELDKWKSLDDSSWLPPPEGDWE